MSADEPSPPRLPVTLADVARAAGVSRATASKALNDRFDVSADTRARVRAAAESLEFSPNTVAQGLTAGRTHSVGIVTSDIDGRFTPAIMRGAENALGAESSSVFLCNTRGRPELERHHIQALLGRRVEGLIIVGDSTEPRPPLDMPRHVPVVYVYAPSSHPDDLSIVPDNQEAGRLAAAHLLDTGRTHIAHVGGPPASKAATDRAVGSRQTLRAAGLDLVTGAPIYGDWLETWGWTATHHLIDRKIQVDGLICGNDQIARGAMDALLDRGLRIPQDAAVVGFDNWEVLSLHARNPITSIDMNLEALGAEAAQALIKPDPTLPTTGIKYHPCTLVTRTSTLIHHRGYRRGHTEHEESA